MGRVLPGSRHCGRPARTVIAGAPDGAVARAGDRGADPRWRVLGLDLLNSCMPQLGDRNVAAVEPGVRPPSAAVSASLSGGSPASWGRPDERGRWRPVERPRRADRPRGGRRGVHRDHLGPQVGAAIGVAVGYVAWMALMGPYAARTGIDAEALKNRFTPVQTIETSKETLEWLQKRMPPGTGPSGARRAGRGAGDARSFRSGRGRRARQDPPGSAQGRRLRGRGRVPRARRPASPVPPGSAR